MAQYIDKDALVAEIEKRQKIHFNDYHINGNNSPADYGACNALTQILAFIDTLEVKEVDFEKEIDKFYGMYRKNGITFSIEDNQECLDWKVDCNPNFVKAFAKHFFELGLKT